MTANKQHIRLFASLHLTAPLSHDVCTDNMELHYHNNEGHNQVKKYIRALVGIAQVKSHMIRTQKATVRTAT